VGPYGNRTSCYCASVEFINTTLRVSHTAQKLQVRNSKFIWRHTNSTYAFSSAGSLPTTGVYPSASGGVTELILDGLDLSNLGTGKSLINNTANTSAIVKIINCKLNADVGIVSNSPTGLGTVEVFLHNCDSGDTHDRFAYYGYQGSVIKATNCKFNADYSQKMVSDATDVPTFVSPLQSLPITKWNSSVGSALTASIQIIHDSLTNLQDDEIWMELTYYGTSGVPLGHYISDRMAWFGTAADQEAGSTWTTEDLTNDNEQKLSVSFTPQEAGYIVAKVCLAKSNYTVYVDPYITVS
jgi:hypothetical protein